MYYIVLQLAIAKDIEMFKNTILIWTRKKRSFELYFFFRISLNLNSISWLNFVAENKVSCGITCLNAIRHVYTSNAS